VNLKPASCLTKLGVRAYRQLYDDLTAGVTVYGLRAR
jgi:hypothetical protein